MKPKHRRLLFVVIGVAAVAAGLLLILRTFEANIIFFYTPSQLAKANTEADRLVRIGGLVKPGSVVTQGKRTDFVVTDGTAQIAVTYEGLLPTLFREGQGVVALGILATPEQFSAREILAKHDENYMPPEVKRALEQSGHWQHQYPGPKQPAKPALP